MTGKDLKSGDIFVIAYEDGRPSRIFKKVGNDLLVLVRDREELEFQGLESWPKVREELESFLPDTRVAIIGSSPGAFYRYF